MIKDDIEELKTAMTKVLLGRHQEAVALSKILRRLGHTQAREVLAGFGVILETKDFIHGVRHNHDWDREDEHV